MTEQMNNNETTLVEVIDQIAKYMRATYNEINRLTDCIENLCLALGEMNKKIDGIKND